MPDRGHDTRLYGRRGYIPDGRGACRGQRPLSKGMQVTMDDDLIIWLTNDLASWQSRADSEQLAVASRAPPVVR
jgi:hypothetical protein